MAKAPIEIRTLARSHTKSAIQTLAKIMTSAKSTAAARVAAANALLDRGWGKPTHPVSGDGEAPAITVIIDRFSQNGERDAALTPPDA